MAATVQSQAIEAANGGLISAQQLMNLYTQLVHLQEMWQDVNVGQTISAMSTIKQNPDGSFGGADNTPNAGNPIDITKYPSLSRAVSSTQMAQIKSILDGVVDYIEGRDVAAQPGARAILNVAVGG